MAKNRRTVRKYKPATRSTFDDYQWPVNMALVVLGGFLVGGVVAVTDRGGGFIFCALIAAAALIGSGPLFGTMGAQARESIPPDFSSGL